jgi:hypothetical protein
MDKAIVRRKSMGVDSVQWPNAGCMLNTPFSLKKINSSQCSTYIGNSSTARIVNIVKCIMNSVEKEDRLDQFVDDIINDFFMESSKDEIERFS